MIVSAFQATESAIRRYLRRFVSNSDQIDDICQEAVARALEAASKKSIEDPKAFLFGVARKVMLKEIERRSRSLVDFVDEVAASDEIAVSRSLESELETGQDLAQLAEIVSCLPPQCQRVFLMKKAYGYSHKEIASKLDISVSTVEKHVALGVKKSLDMWEQKQQEESAAGAVTLPRIGMEDR